MQVILIRHSMTPGNALRRYLGRTDEPLSDVGVALAAAAGSDPAVRTVYVTPRLRTQQTARLLFPNARQIAVDGLREMEFGDFENRSSTEMADDPAYRAWVDSDCLAPCPNGESRAEFCVRVCAAFERIVKDAAARGEETVVFVVHNGTVMATLEHFARPRQEYYAYAVKNCKGYRCQVSFAEAPFVLTDLTAWEGMA